MGDFEREHKAVDAARESEMDNQRTKSINGDPVFDINSIVAEERALNNFSTWNWIGMLHGEIISRYFIHTLTLFENTDSLIE